MCRLVLFILSFCLSTSLFANENKVSYLDPFGKRWFRWVITEQQSEQTVLTVLEEPSGRYDQRFVTQNILDRIVFSNPTPESVSKAKNFYLELKDLSQRPARYYRDLDGFTRSKNPNPLWVPVKTSWSREDESGFSEWYKNHASTKMAQGAGLEFDCADFGLLGRWIYAHDNKLPIANSLAGSGKMFGHFSESSKWSQLPTDPDWKKDERFKAAMKYLFQSTYTRSIFNDLYPTQINKDYIAPGAIILTLRANSGHTQVVYDVGYSNYCGTECLMTLYGNEPARDIGFLAQASIKNHKPEEGGFMRWRWPININGKWQLIEKSKMPGYSLEQYQYSQLSYDEYHDYIFDALGFKIAPYKKAMSLAKGLYYELLDRQGVTALGALNCYYQYCDPQGPIFDQHSTPSKDGRWREKRDQFLRLFKQLTYSEQDRIKNYFLVPVFSYGLNAEPTFWDYIANVGGISDTMSFDPSVSYSERWGIPSSDSFKRESSLLTMFYYIWNFRLQIVSQAVRICGDGKVPLVCDPNSIEVQNLATFEMDEALKAIGEEVSQIYLSLSRWEKYDIISIGDQLELHSGCGVDGYRKCVVTDYLLSSKKLIQNISSDPTQSYRQRLGLTESSFSTN